MVMEYSPVGGLVEVDLGDDSVLYVLAPTSEVVQDYRSMGKNIREYVVMLCLGMSWVNHRTVRSTKRVRHLAT